MSVSNRQMFEAVKMILTVASEKTSGEMPSKFEAIRLEVIAAFYELIGASPIKVSYYAYQIGVATYEIEKQNAERLLLERIREFSLVFYSALVFFCASTSEAASRWWFFEMYGRISWTTNIPRIDIHQLDLDKETKKYCREFGQIMQKYVERDLNELYQRPII